MTNTSKRNEQSELVELFRLLYKGIEKHGINEISKKLKKLSSDGDEHYQQLFTYCVDISCWYFNMPVENFYKFARAKDESQSIARKISLKLMLDNCDISMSELSKYFKKSREILYSWKKEVDRFERNNKIDSHRFFKHYDIIDDKFKIILKSIKKI